MKKHLFQTKRQRKRTAIRKLYGNPWDSTSSSSHRSKSKTVRRSVTFREPIERSASKSKSKSKSKSSSPSNVWRTVSSKSNSK